ncbi:MAG: sterol desaturase family protein [Alphaproteobacteria bacterium]|nr:sterol desaturase family protein [Alphaproteobacteria bacterium]
MPSFLHAGGLAFATLVIPWAAIAAIGHALERASPAEAGQRARDIGLNIRYTLLFTLIRAAAAPLLAAASLLIVGALGGGIITLPSRGWPVIGSCLVFFLAIDFAEYAFHRAQHSSRLLWALHSLHHSDPALNVTTTFRHQWLDIFIKAILVYPAVGILFKASGPAIAFSSIASFSAFFSHANLRLSLGPLWAVLNNPQYHRIHHSSLACHRDKNFAAILPLWDLAFGTCHRPRPGEFPPTGLTDAEPPRRVVEMLVWPLAARPGLEAAATPR